MPMADAKMNEFLNDRNFYISLQTFHYGNFKSIQACKRFFSKIILDQKVFDWIIIKEDDDFEHFNIDTASFIHTKLLDFVVETAQLGNY